MGCRNFSEDGCSRFPKGKSTNGTPWLLYESKYHLMVDFCMKAMGH